MEFEKEGLYMFSLEKFKSYYNGMFPISIHKWAKEVNGKLVDKIIDKDNAIIKNSNGTELIVSSEWCEKIIEAKYVDVNERGVLV